MVEDTLPTPKQNTILKLFNENPNACYTSIGNEVGCSREYIRLVLKKYNLFKPRHYVIHTKVCPSCHKSFVLINKKQIYCSQKCVGEALKGQDEVTLTCSSCNKIFSRPKCQAIRNKSGFHFCSRECKGKWLGLNFGGSKIKKRSRTAMEFSYEIISQGKFPLGRGRPSSIAVLNLIEQLENLSGDKVLKVKVDGNREQARNLGSLIRYKLKKEGKPIVTATQVDGNSNSILYIRKR